MKRIKKRINEFPKCPSCNTERHRTEMKEAIASMENVERNQFKYHKNSKIDAYSCYIDSDLNWACDACLQSKKAIKANPSLQNYCWDPYYAYYDSPLVCRSCKTDFIFDKTEKKNWFERLKFWIDSTPVNCVNCRKEIRTLKRENKMLSDILKKEESAISLSELEKVIEVYTKWKKQERAKYYESILRKRRKVE